MGLRQRNRGPLDGRKYRLAILCLLILLAGFGVAGINPVFAKLYVELISAVLGVLFVYCGGNVTKSWAVGKNDGFNVSQGPPQDPPTGEK